MSSVQVLLKGFQKFRELYFEKDPGLFRDELIARFGTASCAAITRQLADLPFHQHSRGSG